jgi:hypothetical protein
VSEALAAGPDGVGERLVRMLLSVWDSPAGTGTAAILRSAMSNESFARMFREFVTRVILRRLARELDLDPAEASLRTALAATQLAGLIVTRYVIRLEAVASVPAPVLVAAVGPTVQRYLTGPLPAGAIPQPKPAEGAHGALPTADQLPAVRKNRRHDP